MISLKPSFAMMKCKKKAYHKSHGWKTGARNISKLLERE